MSFGAGVQSTALAMLVILRDERLIEGLHEEAEFFRWDSPSPLPELFIFADTHDEPTALYPHLEAMREKIQGDGRKLVIVSRGGLLEHIESKWALWKEDHPKKRGVSPPPFFAMGKDGRAAPTRRQCTNWFKIEPIEREVKRYFSVKRARKGIRGGRCDDRVYGWLGISYDEMQRMKSATEDWRRISHPLVFMRWTRERCAEYLRSLGIEPARSACVYCPFRGPEEWREIRESSEDWVKVLRLDDLLERCEGSGFMGMKSPLYLHRDLVRMRDLDLSEKRTQSRSLWDDECAGVCGV